MKYVAIVVKAGSSYSAYFPDLPGCIAAGDTFEDTSRLIQEAVVFHLEGMAEDEEVIPEPSSIAIEIEVDAPVPGATQELAVDEDWEPWEREFKEDIRASSLDALAAEALEAKAEAEHLVNLHQTIRESAQFVYDVTEKLVDALPEETRSPIADNYVNFAYDKLTQADKLIKMGKVLLSLNAAYPSYPPERKFWAGLERRSDEQKNRLDHHLRFVCLHDSGDLLPRRDAAEAILDGMLSIYRSRDILFLHLDRNHRIQELSSGQMRVLDGVIESSIDFVETIAWVVRRSTQIAPG